MARDRNLLKRNLLAIPGGLLATYGALGLVYVLAVRAPTAPCDSASRFLVGGACYNAVPALAGLLVLGLILVGVGLYAFRGRPADLPAHLEPGTPTHFTLFLLGSLAAIGLVGWAIAAAQGSPAVVRLGGYPFKLRFLLLLLGCVGLLAFLPSLGLYVAQGRLRRSFLREVDAVAAQEEPAFPGEPAAAEAPATPTDPESEPWPDAPAEPWPDAPAEPWPEAPAPAPASDGWTETDEPVAPAPQSAAATAAAVAPVVQVASGCRAVLATGQECGRPVGPGGRYCLSHACQGRTATGSPCKNAAIEGSTRCTAHAAT